MSIEFGVRVECYDRDNCLVASVSREDMRAAAAPAPGDRIGPGRLTPTVEALLPIPPVVNALEHCPAVPGRHQGEPSVTAIIRVQPASGQAIEDSRDVLKEEGWQVHTYGETRVGGPGPDHRLARG